MAIAKKTYKNPTPGQALITTISSGCRTPILDVKFSTLVKPFYYPNSPNIPRYSISCAADPEIHTEFLKGIQAIEKFEKVESIIKNETIKVEGAHQTTGKVLIKFQSKDLIPVYSQQNEGDEPVMMELEDELARGEKVMIIYDILRYTKKNTMTVEHGLSFRPSCIYLYTQN